MSAFVTLEDYEAFIGTSVDGTESAAIEFELDAASDDIRKYCHQTFDLVTDDAITLHGTGRRTLILPELPAVAVSAVSVNGTALTTDEWELDSPDNGILIRTSDNRCLRPGWACGVHNVAVTYTHGYATIPSGLKRAALTLVKERREMAVRSAGIRSETIGSYSYTLSDTTSSSSYEPGSIERVAYCLEGYSGRIPAV
jgi:hypothetical protein